MTSKKNKLLIPLAEFHIMRKILILFVLFSIISCSSIPRLLRKPFTESVEQIIIDEDEIKIEYSLEFKPRSLKRTHILDFKPIVIINSDTISIESFEICGERAGCRNNIVSFTYGGNINILDSLVYNKPIQKLEIISSSTARSKKDYVLTLPTQKIIYVENNK
jgi:hypothetical protein